MSALWNCHSMRLISLINNNNETQAHLYLEQVMLLPLNIQDEIIEKISRLQHCSTEAVSEIISEYTLIDLQ